MSNIPFTIDVHERRRRGWSRREMREYEAATRVYVSHKGESVLENFGNRVARPVKLYKDYLPKIAEALELPSNTKFRWSQKAGCSCGCSPGFIVDGSWSKDVWLTLGEEAPTTNDSPEALAESESRKVQLVGQLTAEKAAVEQTPDEKYADQLEHFLKS